VSSAFRLKVGAVVYGFRNLGLGSAFYSLTF
jgi:hypothetical protein